MRPAVSTVFLLILALNTGWFVAYSAGLGLQALTSDAPSALSRVFVEGAGLANGVLAIHMIAGALLTVGAPIQALPVMRRRWTATHRKFGYVLFVLALVTGLGGLIYIALNGTIGGWWMSLWFALYGAAIIVSSARTIYYALAKDMQRHFAWATRLVILAVGSWIFRMHYVIWFSLTEGAGSNESLTGLFDRIQVVAFFVPYLLIAEVFLRKSGPARPQVRQADL